MIVWPPAEPAYVASMVTIVIHSRSVCRVMVVTSKYVYRRVRMGRMILSRFTPQD